MLKDEISRNTMARKDGREINKKKDKNGIKQMKPR
jgi:hypothetical protein